MGEEHCKLFEIQAISVSSLCTWIIILDLQELNRGHRFSLSTLLKVIVSSFKDPDSHQSHSH